VFETHKYRGSIKKTTILFPTYLEKEREQTERLGGIF
jgi:hypothetical protein